MHGGIRTATGRRGADADSAVLAEEGEQAEQRPSELEDEGLARRSWSTAAAAILACTFAIGWLGLVLYARSDHLLPITADRLITVANDLSAPLALLALVYLIVSRTSRSGVGRLTRVSTALRGERARLEASMASVAIRIEEEQAAIAGHAHALLTIGEDAAGRMQSIGDKLRQDIDVVTRQAEVLRNASGSARRDMTALLGDVPQAHAQTVAMTRTLEAAGLSAHEQAGALDAQVAALVARAREADEVAGGAAQKLAAHLARVESVSESAGGHLVGAAETMTAAIDAALVRAAAAADAARHGMEAQGAAMLALVEQGEAAMERTGAETSQAVARRVADVTGQIGALGQQLSAQETRGLALMDMIDSGITRVGKQFEALHGDHSAKTQDLTSALAALHDHAVRLTGELQRGEATGDAMIGRAEVLLTALDAAARELDETLPAALARLDGHADTSQGRIAELTPQIERIELMAGSTLDRLHEADAALARQDSGLEALGQQAERQLTASKANADALVAAVEAADRQTRDVAEGAGATLIEAMVRVREAGQLAAARAREALAAIVPESADEIGRAVNEALRNAVGAEIEVQLEKLSATAGKAVAAANVATDRLMRQMLTIAETSAQVEARIGEAHSEIDDADRDNFARRVALLIESLNSTAIDVTKVLSNDVTDSAWSAYLKGDRGVFTRRAVRLLDAGEAREVARHYNEDPEFRDQVNRYIHDFEAMLRNVLATRSGSPLGVTLLSSDMGKLYVALAQAIDRLRS